MFSAYQIKKIVIYFLCDFVQCKNVKNTLSLYLFMSLFQPLKNITTFTEPVRIVFTFQGPMKNVVTFAEPMRRVVTF